MYIMYLSFNNLSILKILLDIKCFDYIKVRVFNLRKKILFFQRCVFFGFNINDVLYFYVFIEEMEGSDEEKIINKIDEKQEDVEKDFEDI